MSNQPIHIHKNIVDRKRNTLLLFLPMVVFVFFLTLMFSLYSVNNLSNDKYEATLGEKENIDSEVNFNAQ